jgi:uncharacterized protein (DUF779 family)
VLWFEDVGGCGKGRQEYGYVLIHRSQGCLDLCSGMRGPVPISGS